VIAAIRLGRSSEGADLKVTARVAECLDPGCNTDSTIGSTHHLGIVSLGTPVRLLLQWDPDGNQFIVRRGNQPQQFISYAVPDSLAPGVNSKNLQIAPNIANCVLGVGEKQPAGGMDVSIDNVKVNQSAAP
jgi:hypothetical protein